MNKEVENSIWDSFGNDWCLHKFECVMTDGTTQYFSGILCECYDGSINKHIDCLNDSYDTDDIVLWKEILSE